MSAEQLPPIPLTDEVLDAIEHALATSIDFDDDGARILVGGEYTLPQLLDFLSGYDPSKSILIDPHFDSVFGPGELWEHPEPIYSERDVIGALITEVRRFRAGLSGTDTERAEQ